MVIYLVNKHLFHVFDRCVQRGLDASRHAWRRNDAWKAARPKNSTRRTPFPTFAASILFQVLLVVVFNFTDGRRSGQARPTKFLDRRRCATLSRHLSRQAISSARHGPESKNAAGRSRAGTSRQVIFSASRYAQLRDYFFCRAKQANHATVVSPRPSSLV